MKSILSHTDYLFSFVDQSWKRALSDRVILEMTSIDLRFVHTMNKCVAFKHASTMHRTRIEHASNMPQTCINMHQTCIKHASNMRHWVSEWRFNGTLAQRWLCSASKHASNIHQTYVEHTSNMRRACISSNMLQFKHAFSCIKNASNLHQHASNMHQTCINNSTCIKHASIQTRFNSNIHQHESNMHQTCNQHASNMHQTCINNSTCIKHASIQTRFNSNMHQHESNMRPRHASACIEHASNMHQQFNMHQTCINSNTLQFKHASACIEHAPNMHEACIYNLGTYYMIHLPPKHKVLKWCDMTNALLSCVVVEIVLYDLCHTNATG